MRVLVIRFGAMGDIIHTLPLAADLAAAGCQLEWVCEDRWSTLLTDNPAVDRIWPLPRARWRRQQTRACDRLADIRRLVRGLRSRRYDAVIDAQGLAKSAFLAAVVGSTTRICHAPPRGREGSWLLGNLRVPSSAATHVIDQQRCLALPLTGRVPDPEWTFPLPSWPAARAWARDWLAHQQLTAPWAINVGAGWVTKVWPQERLNACAARLADRGERPLILWGSGTERAVAERVQAAVPQAVLAPATDIPQMAALLSGCRMLISGDTGPLHLARALATPAVGLFGPVPRERNGPRGAAWANLQAPGALWERRDLSKVDMGAITEQEAIVTGDEILARIPAASTRRP